MNALADFFNYGLWFMAAATPLAIAGVSLTFFPMVSVWLLAQPFSFRRWTPLVGNTEKAFLVFFIASTVSALHSPVRAHSLHEIAKDLYIFITVLLVAVVETKAEVRRLLRTFLIAGSVSVVWGLLQYIGGANQTDTHAGRILYLPPCMAHWPRWLVDYFSLVNGRAHGTRSHPITYAEDLLFVLGFVLAYLTEASKTSKSRSLYWSIGGLLTVVALFASLSRGAWIAAGIMGIGVFSIRRSSKAFLWLIIAAISCALLLRVPAFHHRFVSIIDPQDQSNAERVHMWQTAAVLWRESPLLGIGPGNSNNRSAPFQTAREAAGGGWGHFHSNFVNILAERGALGLGGFLLFFTTLLIELAAAYRRALTSEERGIHLAVILGVIGFLISGITETSYNDTKILMMLYFVVGISFVWSRRLSKSP